MSIQNVPNSVANPATRIPVPKPPVPKPNGGDGLIRQVGDLFRDVLAANLRPQQRAEVQRAAQAQPAAATASTGVTSTGTNSFQALAEQSGASNNPNSLETLLNAVTELVKVVRDLVQSVFQSIGALGSAPSQASTTPAVNPATTAPANTQSGTQQPVTEPAATTGTTATEVTRNTLLNRTISWLQDGEKVEAAVKELSAESSLFKYVADKIDLPKAASRLGGLLGAFFG